MRFLRVSHHDCHHSDFEEEIQPAGLPIKRYPFRKPRAAMGELVSSDASDFEEEPEEQHSRELKELLPRQLFGEETALKWHLVHKLVSNQDGDGASPDRVVARQHNVVAS